MESTSNFEFLKKHDYWLFNLAESAERNFSPFPNTTLFNMRQLGEAIAQSIAARIGVESGSNIKQVDLLRDLDYSLRLDDNVRDAFHTIRKLGNTASHEFTSSSHRDALKSLMVGHALAMWFHITFGGSAAKGFKIKKFVKPQDPSEYVRQLEEQVEQLKTESQRSSERIKTAEELSHIESEKAKAEHERAEKMAADKALWEQLAIESDKEAAKYKSAAEAANQEFIKSFLAKIESLTVLYS